MKKLVLLVLIGIGLVLTGCSSNTPVVAATPTVVAPVKDNSAIKAEGKLEPVQSVKLSFAAGGEVAEVLVKEGDMVKAGDVIARVKSDAQQAAVTRAEAGVAAAKASEAKYIEQLPQQIRIIVEISQDVVPAHDEELWPDYVSRFCRVLATPAA